MSQLSASEEWCIFFGHEYNLICIFYYQISNTTTAILIEVTSTTNLDTCKKVLDELLYKMLDMGVGAVTATVTDGAAGGDNSDSDDGVVFEKKPTEKLVVEQVKITDIEGNLKVIYPSRTDLNNEAIKVIRHFD